MGKFGLLHAIGEYLDRGGDLCASQLENLKLSAGLAVRWERESYLPDI